jgi:hypothetical protein
MQQWKPKFVGLLLLQRIIHRAKEEGHKVKTPSFLLSLVRVTSALTR